MTTASSSSGPPPALSERVIIVVDDDATLRSLTSSYLRRAGATVHLAENGREALTLITDLHSSGTAVHAVLCDLRMEGGTGMELYQRVGETLPALAPRMIFSSGDIDSDDVRSFVERGDVRVLAKPYPLAELRRLLTELPPPALS